MFGDHAFQQTRVRDHRRERLRHLQLDRVTVRDTVECRRHHLVEADRPHVRPEHLGLQTAQVKQVGQQPVEPVGTLLDEGSEFAPVRR
jgi:hypothetical protein